MSTKLGLRHDKSFLDGKLLTFLAKKRKSNSIGDQISVLEVFDSILPSIYNIYQEKLQSHSNDEFEFDIVGELSSTDGTFYERYFMPCCIFFMYQEWLKENQFEEGNIYHDLFTQGSGSRTMNKIPEVHGLCLECAPNLGEAFGHMDKSEIHKFNSIVFRKQNDDRFCNQAIMKIMNDDEDISEEHSVVNVNPFDESDEHEDVYHCNPFEFSDDENYENLFLDGCEVCFQSFPSEEFVKLHMKIFHPNKKVQPVYVEEGEDLMSTFIAPEDDINLKVSKVDSSKPRDKKSFKAKSSKYGLRRKLKM